MKKTIAALLLLLLLPLTACENEPAPASSEPSSEVSSETPSQTESVDPNAPLSESEIERFQEQIARINESDDMIEKLQFSVQTKAGSTTSTQESTMLIYVHMDGEDSELYQETINDYAGVAVHSIGYFCDGRMYQITRQGEQSSGYYVKKSYDEVLDTDGDRDTIHKMRDLIPQGEVTRADGEITVSVIGTDEDFMDRTLQNFKESGMIREGEGATFTPTEALLELTLSADGRLRRAVEEISFDLTVKGDGATSHSSYCCRITTDYVSYDDGTVEVPVPEDLASYEEWDDGERGVDL